MKNKEMKYEVGSKVKGSEARADFFGAYLFVTWEGSK